VSLSILYQLITVELTGIYMRSNNCGNQGISKKICFMKKHTCRSVIKPLLLVFLIIRIKVIQV